MLLVLVILYFVGTFAWLLSKRRWKQAVVTALIGLILIAFVAMMDHLAIVAGQLRWQ